MEFIDVFSSI